MGVGAWRAGQREAFRRSLLGWFDEHRRDLPWRRTRDPYAIWVSEVMLQQTRVAAVLEHYARWMDRFADVAALAAAEEAEVLALWSGLGYYRRARFLHAGAKKVVAEYGGVVPGTAAGLRGLPGVGEYTSAAIASIAFGEAIAVVDGNVERVVMRLAGLGLAAGAETDAKGGLGASAGTRSETSPEVGSGGTPEFVSGASPEFVSGGTPEFVSGGTPEFVSGATPEFVSGGTPEFVSGGTPEFVSGASPEFVSGGTPEFVSGGTPEFVSGATPEFVSGATPELTSGATPELTSGATAEASLLAGLGSGAGSWAGSRAGVRTRAESDAGARLLPAAELAREIRVVAHGLLEPGRAGDANQAMMELGATVCLPRGPLCLQCPVVDWCATRGEHVSAPRKAMQAREVAYALVERERGGGREVLLVQRPVDASLMAGMWELPALGSVPEGVARVLTVKHAITVTNYTVRVVGFAAREMAELGLTGVWVGVEELPETALTGLARKVLKRVGLWPVVISRSDGRGEEETRQQR
jgi:adenine-specific DNA glycosylase